MNTTELADFSRAIIRFYEKLSSWEHAVAKNTGLSPQQNHTIDIVGSTGPIRMKPLAEHLSITTGTLTVMINRLENSGYVRRTKDPADGRGFNIVLTKKGQRIHKEHHAYHIKLTEDILSHLDADQAERFIDILTRVNESI
jgi:DNA-binding MarR family transcriptional regulator